MIARTSMPQSIGAILDGMKHNALQAVRQTVQESQQYSVPLDGDVHMGWTDKDGRTRSETVTGLSLDGERLKVQVADRTLPFVLDEQQHSTRKPYLADATETMPSETSWHGKGGQPD